MTCDADIDAVVIGAGVIGLACARELAKRGYETIILESHNAIGTETSARNSEVIHAGLYYPRDSLKARFCLNGKKRLYEYLESHKLPYRQCGKLIVASDATQQAELSQIARQAEANGVEGIRWLSATEVRKLEPELNASAALLSSDTGIVDAHAYMLSLQGEFEDAGGSIALNTKVERVEAEANFFTLHVSGTDAGEIIRSRKLINAAGLWATHLARRMDGLNHAALPEPLYARGNYFSLSGHAPFSHLIYPVPEPGGLGTHLTLDLGGQARFGPDVEWITLEEGKPDYTLNPERGDGFYAAIRKYWPGLKDNVLQPAYAGIRPKLRMDGKIMTDFVLSGPETHGIDGLVNLLGIESPGLTASLAIAEEVADRFS